MITSIILALYLLGIVSAKSAAVFLLVSGILLIASEFFLPSGVVAFSGLLALYVAYSLQYGQHLIFGVPMGWSVFFGIALVEGLVATIFIALILRHRKHPTSTGVESMIGHTAEIIEWSGQQGRVRIQGEQWQATSEQPLALKPEDKVVVDAVENLSVKIKALH